MKDLIAEFHQAGQQFQQTVEKFPQDQQTATLFDKWSLKDLIAHILGWHQLFLTNLDNLTNGKVPADWGKIDDFNHQNVVAFKSTNFSQIFQKLIDTDNALIKKLESLSSPDWQKKFWPNRTYTPQKILEIEIKHYLKTHLPQIKNYCRP